MSVYDNRLTAADYAAIDARLSDTLAEYCQSHPAFKPGAWEYKRQAWHAIGCSEYDLRNIELTLIGQQVEAICGFYCNGARR